MPRLRLAALALVAALCSGLAAGRTLLQADGAASFIVNNTITGKAIVIARDLLGRKGDKILALNEATSGRRLYVPNVDASVLDDLQSGDTIQVSGEVVQVLQDLYTPDPVEGGIPGYSGGGGGGDTGTPLTPKQQKRLDRLLAKLAKAAAKVAKKADKRQQPQEQLQPARPVDDGSDGSDWGSSASPSASAPSPPPAGRRRLLMDGGGARRRLMAVNMAALNPILTSSLPTLYSELRVIVIPIQAIDPSTNTVCPGTTQPTVSRLAIRTAMFSNITASVAEYAGDCSNSRLSVKEGFQAPGWTPGSWVAPRISLPCSGTNNGVAWSFSACQFDDFNGFADAADAVVANITMGNGQKVDLSYFTNRVYLLPPSACNFVGMGYVGCDDTFPCRTWIGPDFWREPQTISHELGHNMYMGHAGAFTVNGTFDEYLDDSCVMGYCCEKRCPNAAHAWQLGWTQHVLLNGTNLAPGTTLNLTVFTASQSYNRTGLRIRPSWAPAQNPFFVSFRTRDGGDADLPNNLANKVHIHQAPIAGSFDSSMTTWRAVLGVGQSFSNGATGIVVRRLPSTNPNAAVVTVCRRAGSENAFSCNNNIDNNCDGRAGDDDPACSIFL